MAAGDYTLNIGHLTGLGGLRPEADDIVPQNRPGTVSMVVDAFGFGIFKYIRAIAALTKGQLAQLTGTGTTPIFDVSNQTGAFTTKAITSGLTANDEQGKIVWVLDAVAGALPEGEVSVVASNTATVIQFEPELPLSTALTANDDLTLVATYQVEVGTGGTFGTHCPGVAVGNGGITAGRYGWVKSYGIINVNNVGTPTTVLGANMKAATTGTVDATGTLYADAALVVGINQAVTTNDQATPKSLVNMRVFTVNTALSG